MMSEQALAVIESDFKRVAGARSTIPAEQLAAFFELQLSRVPTQRELGALSAVSGGGELQLSTWVQFLQTEDLSAEASTQASLVYMQPEGAVQVVKAIHSGEKSCAEVTEAYLSRIQAHNQLLNACIEVLHDSARAAAAAVDAKVQAGQPLRPLEGLPILLKANIDAAGTLTTASTAALSEWRPTRSAPCVERLLCAGAIVIGKTNMPEMAFHVCSWNRLHGLTRNPHSIHHDPAGSSSGTGAGIAAGFAPCGLGSDTSGSIRLPAAACGIVGFRPSNDRWPAEGVVPICCKNDTAGPMGTCVADVALLDAVVMQEAPVQIASASAVLDGLTVAIPTEWIKQAGEQGNPVAASFVEGLKKATAALESEGAAVLDDTRAFLQPVVKGSSFFPEMAPPHSFCHADLQSYLERHPDRPQGIQTAAQVHEKQQNAKIFFEPPDNALAAQLEERFQKQDANVLVQESAYVAWLEQVGARALLVPVTTCEPVSNKGWTVETIEQGKMPEVPFNAVAWFTKDLNSIHIPSITLPVHSVKCQQPGCESLPVSVMLLGRPNEDRELLAMALALEQAMKG